MRVRGPLMNPGPRRNDAPRHAPHGGGSHLAGVSLIEVLAVALLVAFLVGSVVQIIRGGHRGVREAMYNHLINDDGQRLVARLSDELREANLLDPVLPTIKPAADLGTLQTTDATNQLMFAQYTFDFTKDPNTFAPRQKPYTQLQIIYQVEKMDPNAATGPYALRRTETPWDEFGNPLLDQKKSAIVMSDLDEIIFFRIAHEDGTPPGPATPAGTGPDTVHVRFRQRRTDAAALARPESYRLDTQFSVKIRGAVPE